jgi:hypothetical protein
MSNEPWLIKNSTKEERQKRVNGALAIQLTGGGELTSEDMERYQKYVDGEVELEEIKDELIKKYSEININWDVIQKIEVLNEVGAGVIADFLRQLQKRKIETDDKSNPIVIFYWQTVRLKNSLIDMNTIKELNDAQAQLNFVNQYVKKLGACNYE